MGSSEVKELVTRIQELFGEESKDIRTYSGLTLAYIGDSIYDVVIRTMLVSKGNAPVKDLHRAASRIVKAEAQKDSFFKIEKLLSEDEMAVYKRGRNSKPGTTAKNASIGDYKVATGYEALVGYLYMTGQTERMLYLIGKGLDVDLAGEADKE